MSSKNTLFADVDCYEARACRVTASAPYFLSLDLVMKVLFTTSFTITHVHIAKAKLTTAKHSKNKTNKRKTNNTNFLATVVLDKLFCNLFL